MEAPDVTVVIPCYNQGHYLEEAVRSVIDQTSSNWECIIVNDGSSDDTEEIANILAKNDQRIKFFSKKNEGLSVARNYGIQYASGKYILPLDADDKIAEQYLDLAIKEFKKNKQLKIVYSKAALFGTESGIWNLPEFSLKTLASTNMIFCSALFKKEDWLRVGGYNKNMEWGLEDWDFWIRILKTGGEVMQLPQVLFYYRKNRDSMTKNLVGLKHQKMMMQLYLNHQDFFDRYFEEPIDAIYEVRVLKEHCRRLECQNQTLKDVILGKPKAVLLAIKKSLTIKPRRFGG